MSIAIYLFVMQVELISNTMLMAGLTFFGYYGWQYVKLWWHTPSDEPVPSVFWKKRRKQTIVAGAVLLIGLALPSRTEAVAQYAAWKVANASVWDRLFTDKASFADTVGRMIDQNDRK